jgi:hypothetical protein
MSKELLKTPPSEENISFADVHKLYEYAYEIEKMLIENGAVADKDYKILDLFKLAVEWRKAISIEYVGEMTREQHI